MRQASIAKSTQVSPVEYIVKTRRLILNLIFLMMIFLLQTKVLSARGVPESFADLVENVGAAVVNITTTTVISFLWISFRILVGKNATRCFYNRR